MTGVSEAPLAVSLPPILSLLSPEKEPHPHWLFASPLHECALLLHIVRDPI